MNNTDQLATDPASPRSDPHAFKIALDRAGDRVLPANTRLDGCEIVGLVGVGKYSIVYLAYDYALGHHVAVKEYMPAALASRARSGHVGVQAPASDMAFDMGLRSFLSEARLLSRFDAPSLVKILRFWEANGTAYMAMPFYQGVSLRQAVASGRFDASENGIGRLLGQLLEAVDLLHRAHCQHPDIAPDNILLLTDGRPLLLDFGAARRVIVADTEGAAAALRPGFAPIEDYEDIPNLKRGPWTDVYALAAVAYFMIAGKAPPAAVARLANDELVPARQAGAGRYSAAFLAAIDQALAVMPQQRIQSVSQFRLALTVQPDPRKAARQSDSADAAAMPWPEVTAGRGRHARSSGSSGGQSGRRMAGIASIVLALLVAAGFWDMKRTDPAAVGADGPTPATAVAGRAEEMPAAADQPAPPGDAAAAAAQGSAQATSPEETRWRVASSLNNASAYENYLAEYPNGRHAETARAVLESLRAGADAEPALTPADPVMQEESLWSAVRRIDKPLAYESFLRRHPNGRYASAARERLARLRPQPTEAGPAFEPPAADIARRPPATGGLDARTAATPAPAAYAALAVPPAAAPPAQDRLAAVRPPEPPAAAARLPQPPEPAAELDAEAEAAPPPAPGRGGRTLRLANQIMTGNFFPDPATGVVSGSGRIVWDNGDQFEGTLVRGQKEGKGEFRWANGQRYRGEWARDQPNGKGTIQFPNGDRYSGDMRNGLPNGAGTLVFANGNRYQGEVRDGQPNGTGTLTFANGNRYRGEMRDGLPHGTGTNRFSNGDSYTGAFRRGRSDGQGRYTWANGNYWEGEFRDDVKTANGRMVYASEAPASTFGETQRGSAAGGAAGYERDVSERAR